MEKVFLSRRSLESMSTQDLISLADDYGLDIPANLNRSFIIGELLAFGDELQKEEPSSVILSDDDKEIENTLPATYNETLIRVLPRNPAWAFVYWDFRPSDIQNIKDDFLEDSIFLRINYFSHSDSDTVIDSFDVQVPLSDRERYVLLSPVGRFFSVDLTVHDDGANIKILAQSNRMEGAPQCAKAVLASPGEDVKMSPLVALSGMEQILHDHFVNHRQAF